MIFIALIVLIFLVEVPIQLRRRAKLDEKRFEMEQLERRQRLANENRAFQFGRRLPPPDSRQRVG